MFVAHEFITCVSRMSDRSLSPVFVVFGEAKGTWSNFCWGWIVGHDVFDSIGIHDGRSTSSRKASCVHSRKCSRSAQLMCRPSTLSQHESQSTTQIPLHEIQIKAAVPVVTLNKKNEALRRGCAARC